jgi:hypothetical protein
MELCSSFDKLPQTDEKSNNQLATSQLKTLNGQNALLSLMSQDDFIKLK